MDRLDSSRAPRQSSNYTITAAGLADCQTRLRELLDHREQVLAQYRDLRSEQSAEPGEGADQIVLLRRLDHQVSQLETILMRARPSPHNHAADETVQLGSTVTLRCDGIDLRVMLVSSIEADPSQGRVSIDSPLGQALVNRTAGASIEITQTRRPAKTYLIVSID